MGLKCCVPGCNSRPKQFKLYLAPYTDVARWKEWRRVCPFLTKLRPMQLQNARFCKLHFKPEHLNEQQKLTKDALPMLNLHHTDSNRLTDIQTSSTNSELQVHCTSNPGPSGESNLADIDMTDIQTRSTDNKVTNSELQVHCMSNPGPSGESNITDIDMTDIQTRSTYNEVTNSELQVHCMSNPGPSGESNLADIDMTDIQTSSTLKEVTNSCMSNPGPSGVQASGVHSDIQGSTATHSIQTTPVRVSKKPIHRRLRLRLKNVSRVRLFGSDTTPRKQKLQNNNRILKAKYNFLKRKYDNLKQKSAMFCPKTSQFIKKYKTLNAFGKLLVDSQLRLSGVSPHGRRYTTDEKIFAISICKLSPKCFAFLRKCNIILPCKSGLNSLLANIPLRPGINDFIFQHLADTSVGKSEEQKQCALLFDEMAINNSINFNFHTGVIEGLEDIGSGKRTANVANKALVFMLRGLFAGWKLPIAFYFVRDGIKTFQLKNILREVIRAVLKSGFRIRVSVSDQGSANLAAIKSLIADTRADLLRMDQHTLDIIYYKIDEHVIYHMFDVPHLLKCFRNNLQKKDLLIAGQQRAQWLFVKMLYNVDGSGGKARSTKLTDKHIDPQGYDKMKVKYAAQVFSHQVSTALGVYMKTLQQLELDHGITIPNVNIENGFVTAELLQFINDLFDSLNCFGYTRGPYQQALTSNSAHFAFWNEALKKLTSMRFDVSDKKESHPPSLKNFVHDIKTIKQLWTDLSKLEGVKFLSLRRLNQDALENFFGQIRGHGGFNINPDCCHFVSAYKTLLVNNISTGKSLYTNCASDDDKMLGTLQNLVQYRSSNKLNSSHGIQSEICANSCEVIDQIPEENVLQTQSVSYIAGAVCRSLLSKLPSADCDVCKTALLSDIAQPFHILIESREYCTEKKSLYYPSKNLSFLVWESIYIIDKMLPEICNVYVYPELISALEKHTNTSWFPCTAHKKDFFTAFWLYVIKMQVKQWCINFNRRIHNVDSRPKAAEMETFIQKNVTKGLSYRCVRRRRSTTT